MSPVGASSRRRGSTMHIAIFAATLAVLLAGPALAQGYGVPAGPKLGEIEVKAYQPIPKAKVAVQLTSDTHLSRELRRQVMIRLSRRGNEVGFSGGNVMRVDVSYFDFSGNRGGGTTGQERPYNPDGVSSIPLLSAPIRPGGSAPAPASAPTLRLTLTLYAIEGGK